mmetsp:Transcript_2306/g.4424  ORF Transcript_2306/g.4424 Transcript_2306/m.4424 type:complete len:84 (-) Transcript_2306:167-418(-)
MPGAKKSPLAFPCAWSHAKSSFVLEVQKFSFTKSVAPFPATGKTQAVATFCREAYFRCSNAALLMLHDFFCTDGVDMLRLKRR